MRRHIPAVLAHAGITPAATTAPVSYVGLIRPAPTIGGVVAADVVVGAGLAYSIMELS